MRGSYLAFIFILAIASGVRAQDSLSTARQYPKAQFGFKAGVNLSWFSAATNSQIRAKAGPALGIYLVKQVGPKLFFRPELYYSNQGEQVNYLFPFGAGPSLGSTTINQHYVNLPLLLQLGSKISFDFGVQAGILVAAKEKGTVESVPVDENEANEMNKADFSFVLGVGYTLKGHLNCGARINLGVSSIYKSSRDSSLDVKLPEADSRVAQFFVAYSF